MIDIKLIRENTDLVKENIKKKFQDNKLHLVDEVKELDLKARSLQTEGDNLKAEKNKLSKEIGILMKDGKKEEADEVKEKIDIDELKATMATDVDAWVNEAFEIRQKEQSVEADTPSL